MFWGAVVHGKSVAGVVDAPPVRCSDSRQSRAELVCEKPCFSRCWMTESRETNREKHVRFDCVVGHRVDQDQAVPDIIVVHFLFCARAVGGWGCGAVVVGVMPVGIYLIHSVLQTYLLIALVVQICSVVRVQF